MRRACVSGRTSSSSRVARLRTLLRREEESDGRRESDGAGGMRRACALVAARDSGRSARRGAAATRSGGGAEALSKAPARAAFAQHICKADSARQRAARVSTRSARGTPQRRAAQAAEGAAATQARTGGGEEAHHTQQAGAEALRVLACPRQLARVRVPVGAPRTRRAQPAGRSGNHAAREVRSGERRLMLRKRKLMTWQLQSPSMLALKRRRRAARRLSGSTGRRARFAQRSGRNTPKMAAGARTIGNAAPEEEDIYNTTTCAYLRAAGVAAVRQHHATHPQTMQLAFTLISGTAAAPARRRRLLNHRNPR